MKKVLFTLSFTLFWIGTNAQRVNLRINRNKEFRGIDSGKNIFVKNLIFNKGTHLKLEGVTLYVFGKLEADKSNFIHLTRSKIYHVGEFSFENEHIEHMSFKKIKSKLLENKCNNWAEGLKIKK